MKIKRVSTGPDGTFGVLLFGGIPFAVTVEREWVNNQSNLSCIPEGAYTCKRVNSPRFGNTFEVTGVEGRSHILFHKGNVSNDSRGCIIVGEQFGIANGKPAVLASGEGFKEFLSLVEHLDKFDLLIEWCI